MQCLLQPEMVFTTPILHPNIHADGAKNGKVCISILHTGRDFTGYEQDIERWSPVQSVEKVLLSVSWSSCCLLKLRRKCHGVCCRC